MYLVQVVNCESKDSPQTFLLQGDCEIPFLFPTDWTQTHLFGVKYLWSWLFILVVYPSGSDFCWCQSHHTLHHMSQPDPPIGLVLLPLFSHFRVPYKSSGPGLMLSNEKRQGHTMLVDDVSSLRPLLYCSRCLRSSSHPKTWAAKVLLSFLAIYGIQGCIRPCPTSQLR